MPYPLIPIEVFDVRSSFFTLFSAIQQALCFCCLQKTLSLETRLQLLDNWFDLTDVEETPEVIAAEEKV
jgi:hypothetical protein